MRHARRDSLALLLALLLQRAHTAGAAAHMDMATAAAKFNGGTIAAGGDSDLPDQASNLSLECFAAGGRASG